MNKLKLPEKLNQKEEEKSSSSQHQWQWQEKKTHKCNEMCVILVTQI